jgi:hypothetical protein
LKVVLPAGTDRALGSQPLSVMVIATGCDASCAAAKPGLQTATVANTDISKMVRETRHATPVGDAEENGLIG